MDSSKQQTERPVTIGRALRLWLVFQIKLAADALRDLLLSPVSALAIVADLLLRNPESDSLFHRLMSFGRRTERFIDLFGHGAEEDVTLGEVLDRAEQTLRERGSGS